jgi:hypothetical protein
LTKLIFNDLSAIVEKTFIDYKLGLYVFDGEKNIYTVNKIDLSKVINGVSSLLIFVFLFFEIYIFQVSNENKIRS